MAWLEKKGEVFRIRFRFGGAKHLCALGTTDETEAQESLALFEANLRLIDRGIIEAPPQSADLGLYILSGGKHTQCPADVPRPKRATLKDLFDGYLTSFPKESKEENTWKTETIHIGHFRRLLDVNLPLVEVTQKTIQNYINARTRETGKYEKKVSRETVRKELGTLSSIWNSWGVVQRLIESPPPLAHLTYPKGKKKLKFKTREQIERVITRGRLSADARVELWHSLFLTLSEVEEFLNHVRDADRPAYVYPMLVFAAHTGARRSEIRRALVSDFDFEAKTILIREKKKDPTVDETHRDVPMSPRLEAAMQEWFAKHPGGPYAICTPTGRAITDDYATKIIAAATRGSKWAVIPGWHCLRHSFISNCAARGVDQRLIDDWVGHTTEEMRRRYRHLVPDVSKAALLSVFGGAVPA
jgi:integrase